jgi:hypothetical protein
MANYSAAAGFSRISGVTLPSLRKASPPFVHQVDFGQCPMNLPDLGRVDGFRTGQDRAKLPQSDRACARHRQGHPNGIAQ